MKILKKTFSVKKILVSLCLFFAVFFLFKFSFTAGIAAADDYGLGTAAAGTALRPNFPGSSGLYVSTFIGTIIRVVMGFLGALFFALIVYGGLLWMTAHGNDTQVKKAQTVMYQATIGLIIVLAAYAITAFIASLF